MANRRKTLITTLKFAISAALIYFIFSKVDVSQILEILRKTNPLYLLLAFLLFVLSKIIAGYRLNLYFHQLKIFLTQKSNLKLYLLGMFYNLFLPGGIGGDAYKGYLIKKKFDVKTKKIVAVLVLDRLSGLLLLLIYACFLAIILQTDLLQNFKMIFATAAFASVVIFWYVHKRFFTDLIPVFWQSFLHSAFVQLAQLGSAYFILKSLGIEMGTVAYLFIFLISSMVSVLPLTIGGIGSREITFYYGATFLGLDQNTSVGISMVFFLITAIVSLFGIYYHFKKVKLEVVEKNP